jgi:ubiquinone/menaquinone biosynthesis C-methylase UbiE
MTTIGVNRTHPATRPAIPAEMIALKDRLKATWMAGDYDYFSRFMERSAVEFLDRLGLPAGASLLDVACGSGQLALVAARRGYGVTGVDIAANWIEAARARARFENLPIQFDEGDAEDLPYADAQFDAVATLYGAMFAPRPERVAAELLRVTKPGGIIAMANWNAEGFVGAMFKVIAKFIAPPGMPSPLQWGDEEIVRQRFADGVSELRATRVTYTFEYPFSPSEVVDFFRKYYGPTARGFASLDESTQRALHGELTDLWSAHNTATDGTTRVTSEYLEVRARRA